MRQGRNLARAAQVCALMAGCALAPSASALYVGMYAIGDFTDTCGGNDISAWPGMVQAWWDEMRAKGHYGGPASNQYRYVNGNMTIQRFCDPNSYNASCRDFQSASPSGVDWMDAAIIATHGWDDVDRWGGLMRWAWNGDCALRFGGGSNMARVGDSWIKFLHASSCQSADDDNLPGIRLAMQDAATSSNRAHQFLGFHGLMWIWSAYNGNYKESAKDGHSSSVAYSWVTNHYKSNSQGCAAYDPFNWFGTCSDQCPVGYAISNTVANAVTRLENERYNLVYSNPPSNGAWAWMAYLGCDPVGETTWAP